MSNKHFNLIASILGTIIPALPIDPADQQKLRDELDELHKCNKAEGGKKTVSIAAKPAKSGAPNPRTNRTKKPVTTVSA